MSKKRALPDQDAKTATKPVSTRARTATVKASASRKKPAAATRTTSPPQKAARTLTPFQQWASGAGALDQFLAFVLEGGHMADFCRQQGFAYTTVLDWINADGGRAEMYARAREARSDKLADEIVAIADECEYTPITDMSTGETVAVTFANGIEPVSVSTAATLPTMKSTTVITWQGTLYRWDGSKYSAEVAVVDLTGQIDSAKLADNAVTMSKIATGAGDAGKLASGAVTTDKISGGLCPHRAAVLCQWLIYGNCIRRGLSGHWELRHHSHVRGALGGHRCACEHAANFTQLAGRPAFVEQHQDHHHFNQEIAMKAAYIVVDGKPF